MAPSRRKGRSKSAAAAAAARRQWNVGDLVLAKVKGFPAWPATEIADCFDKLKEKSQVDQLSSNDVPTENAIAQLTAADLTGPNVLCDSKLRSSDSSTLNDQRSLAVEEVLTEVEPLRLADDAGGTILAVPNTSALRKKARSHQPRRCSSQKKGSVQRLRSSSRSVSHELQNDVPNCNGGIDGFWDGLLIKAKRSKNVGDSPMCKSNGTLDDNGSGVARADSESLSNNEGTAIESENKREHPEVANGKCDGSLELSKRLDFRAKTAIVRKKRNPGRKRVQSDGRGSTSRLDGEVNNDIVRRQHPLTLPTLFENMFDNHPKDEGDEHLPLAKRARVRMGKLLSREQHEFDVVVMSEENFSETVSISQAREDPYLICNYIQPQTNVLTSSGPVLSSPIGNFSQEPEKKLQPQKTHSCIDSDSMICLASDNCVNAPEDKPQTGKVETSQEFGCKFDGESALPPSKRLHRALEAMSANVAQETQISLKENLPSKTDNKSSHLPFVVDELQSNLDSQNDLMNCNFVVEGSHDCSPPTCGVIGRVSENENVPDSINKDLDSVVTYMEDTSVEVAVSTDNKDYRVSDSSGVSHTVAEEMSLPATLTSVIESIPILESLTPALIELHLEQCSKVEEDYIHDDEVEINNSVSVVHVEEGTVLVSPKAIVNNGCCGDTTMILSGIANDVPGALVDENEAKSLVVHGDDVKHTATHVIVEPSSLSLNGSSPHRNCHGASNSGKPSHNQNGPNTSLDGVDAHNHVSHSNDLIASSNNSVYPSPNLDHAVDANLHHDMHASIVGESNFLDTCVSHQTKPRERTNLAEVKANLASLELSLGSLSRTKESIGGATRIAVDCVKFGVAAQVVELLVLYLERESSLHKRVDLFFLVDSIAQCCRSLKGEVGGSYISAVKETLARLVSAAAPSGQEARDNRRQCLKVLRLWLERRILPESIIRQHIQELDSLNCSISGHSRRTSRTERPFDDPLRDMEGILLDEYGSNSSFQFPEFCMPRMLKEEEEEEVGEGSDSDDGSFEAVTPEHDSKIQDTLETTTLPAVDKRRHFLEDVDGELEMEDVAPTCEAELDITSTASGADMATLMHHSQKQLTSFPPPLPNGAPPQAPPMPTTPPPLPPPPPPLPPPHALPYINAGRNGIQEAMPSQAPAPGVHHSMQSHPSTSYNSYTMMPNPVGSGNNFQVYNHRPQYPSPSNHFSHHPADHQFQLQSQVPQAQPLPLPPQLPPPPPPPPQLPPPPPPPPVPPPTHPGHFYGDQNNFRPPRPEFTENWGPPRPDLPENWGTSRPESTENWGPPRPDLTENWGYSRPTFPRPKNRGWEYPPHSVHPQSNIPSRPPCDGPAYWRPR